MAERRYIASLVPGPGEALADEFGSLGLRLQRELDMPVWLLVQRGKGKYDSIDEPVRDQFLTARGTLPRGNEIALVIDSPGGDARATYEIATLIRRICGKFTVVIPRYAKSAATLLSLGANTIIMGRHAELGPLDAIHYDPDREGVISALDQVQCLERLSAFALGSVDQTMVLLVGRSRKKIDALLPIALDFVADMMRPLFEKVDVVQNTMVSRILKVAEDYAVRLLQPKFSKDEAEEIARKLVGRYSEHGFLINREEAIDLRLPVRGNHTDELEEILEAMLSYLHENAPTYVGQIQEVTTQ